MLGMSFEQWKNTIQGRWKWHSKGQRRGQYLMNHLPESMQNHIVGTEADCFYDDKKIEAFFTAVEPLWRAQEGE